MQDRGTDRPDGAAAPDGLTVVEGTAAAVVFQNEENGYTVLKLRGAERNFTAVGCIPGVFPGERLRLRGAWTSHGTYGEQFKVENVERKLPDTVSAIYDYLSSGAIKGLGAKTARLIVEEFGTRSLTVIDETPEKLSRLKGISWERSLEIGRCYRRQADLRRLMSFFSENGVRPVAAARLYRNFGDRAMEEVANNPYILTDEEYGMDFFEADTLALRLGFDAASPERVSAAVLFEMRHNTRNGHVFLPREKLLAATAQLINVDAENADSALHNLEESTDVRRERVAGVDACYLEDLYIDECAVAERIGEMARRGTGFDGDAGDLADSAEQRCGLRFVYLQREAVKAAATSLVLVLTGGPGTGKTTTVRGILELFDQLRLTTLLAAPTGRAAKRLSELTGRPAQTVHRLLGAGAPVDGGSEFQKCASDPLRCDALVLDEMSMMDISLMAALLDALPVGARLVMVGDADQLPSVGPGNVLMDIIRSGVVPVVSLTEIFRQARRSAIVTNAHLINSGKVPPMENGGDFFFLRRLTPEKTAETVTSLVAKRLPENMGIPSRDIQVLCPSRRGGAGVRELNRAIQRELNPRAPGRNERLAGEDVFRVGDRVMQTRNDYDLPWYRVSEGETLLFSQDGTALHSGESGTGVFNGDVGYIESIDDGREIAVIRFEDRLVPYPFEQLTELELAYAVTVHKSQGSEYRAVILALPRTPRGLVTRGLLYTAVTRARELLVIVGDPEVYAAMTANDRRQRRYSGLRARLVGEVGADEET